MTATATHTKITTISGRIFLRKNGTEKLKWQEKESPKNKSRENRLLFFLIWELSFLKMKILHFKKRKFIIFKNERGKRKRENEKRQIEK